MPITTSTRPSPDIPLDRLDSTSTSFHPNDFESATTMPTTRPSLPPVDGGRQAWAYLLSATVLETLVWGFPLSYGVFLSYYLTIWPDATSILPQVGTVSTGIMYLFLPPLALVLAKNPHLRPASMWLGMLISTGGILASGFVTHPWQLILTQGVMYATGGIFLYCPVTSYMFEWWQKRRGLASGILFSGTGLGGLTVPFIASALLETYGRRVTCIAFSIAYAILLALTIPFIRPRLPLTNRLTDADAQRERARIDWGFLRGRAFWLLACGVVLQGLGGFVPGTYLPSFAESIHLDNTTGTLSLALMNLARIPGQIIIGHLSDLVDPRRLILTMAGLSAASVYAFWGRADGEPLLLVFSLLFGAFAGSYTALFPRFIAIVSDNDPNLPPILYALFSFARGLGNIASGPLSTRLLASHSKLDATGGYGLPGYGVLIIFTGATLAASGVGAAYKGFKRE